MDTNIITLLESRIVTMRDVQLFISHCYSFIGLGFHPDTPFGEYACEGNDLFNPSQAKYLDAKLVKCFWLCNSYRIDLYEIAVLELKIFQTL